MMLSGETQLSHFKGSNSVEMSSTTTSTTTIIPKWDGDPKTAEKWMYKFTAACTLKTVDGTPCHKVIREEFEAELPTDENAVLDATDADDAKKILALKQNEQVMAMLMIAMNTDEGMCKVMQEMNHSPIFQIGKAWRVIKMIKEMCRPDDMIVKVEMDAVVSKIKLKKGENPKVLLEQMSNIEVRFGQVIDVEKKTGVVLKCGKDKYSSVMTTCTTSHKMVHKRAPTCDELIADMYTQWRIDDNNSGGKNDIDEDDVKETALASIDEESSKKDDKRVCYKCGETGHIARDCPTKGSTENLDVVVCNHCNKPGHKEDDCWVKHPEKRPGVNIGGTAVEFLLAAVEVEERLWNADELAVSNHGEEGLLNLVESKDPGYELSLDRQEGLCELEDENKGLYNLVLVDSKGLVETDGRLENSDELEDRSRSTIEREKRVNNLVDSKDLVAYELGDHGFDTGAEDKEKLYVGSHGYGTEYKYQDEKYVDSRGCDTKYEDDMKLCSHGFGAEVANRDEDARGKSIAKKAIEQEMLKAEDSAMKNKKIENKQKYSEVDEYTHDIQSKEGVRMDQMRTLNVSVDVGVDVGDVKVEMAVGQNLWIKF